MDLTVLAPHAVLLREEPVESIRAEGREGSFGILPRHIDYVSALVPGILSYRRADGSEGLFAVNYGTLVKRGAHVRVSVRDAVESRDLETLRSKVVTRYRNLDERQRLARSALATLESRFIRQFVEQVRRGRT
jgi:F-type H+-transporting ATPase subunit epsilon